MVSKEIGPLVPAKPNNTADETWSELNLRKLLNLSRLTAEQIPGSGTSVMSTGVMLLLP